MSFKQNENKNKIENLLFFKKKGKYFASKFKGRFETEK